ncbi:MAG: 1-deoxy-D-xylulose-5-phosphate synthase [Treponema sp.]|nr:1-deoxy-D-xylulose-5-phosphate synthase [Treponema sp.]
MQEQKPLLSNIHLPEDIKNLDFPALDRLSLEMRDLIISTVSRNGGHLASNLGIIELSIVLHRVFDSPVDKIVWDVGHQCYAHKILTGRSADFPGLRRSGGIAGFPKTNESVHDSFNTGHASTSISAALGILTGRKSLGIPGRVIAVIGDGALSGGLAYEALSHAGESNYPLIVVLNDNKMSIGPNVGAFSKYLSKLSMKEKYQKFRRAIDNFIRSIPGIGFALFKIINRLKRAIKAVFYTDNFFVDLGFEYVGPIDGHKIPQLIKVIEDAKNLNKAVVIHVMTKKGRGYAPAEANPGIYHGVPSFDITKGYSPDLEQNTFTRAFSKSILALGSENKKIAVITAAMADGCGVVPFKEAYPDRFFDVDIAEAHAVTFAAGLAMGGLKPVVAIYSTFIQRAVDQIIHDVCLQNLGVTFVLDRSGLVSDDGETHQGIFDISIFRSAPNLTILSPAGEEELNGMLNLAATSSSPVMIRYPKAICPSSDPAFSLPLEEGRGVFIKKQPGNSICILFTGSLYREVLDAGKILDSAGIGADLYNIRYIKPIDEDFLKSSLRNYKKIVVAEEGSIRGGFGEYLCSLAEIGNSGKEIRLLGVREGFDALGKREDLLERTCLDGKGIATAVMELAKT